MLSWGATPTPAQSMVHILDSRGDPGMALRAVGRSWCKGSTLGAHAVLKHHTKRYVEHSNIVHHKALGVKEFWALPMLT